MLALKVDKDIVRELAEGHDTIVITGVSDKQEKIFAAAGEPVTVIANCSTIEALRLELVKGYQPVDYWAD